MHLCAQSNHTRQLPEIESKILKKTFTKKKGGRGKHSQQKCFFQSKAALSC